MAEYLDPRDGYTLVTLPDWQAPQPWWIEVPEGALSASSFPGIFFFNSEGKYKTTPDQDWRESKCIMWKDNFSVWQRPTQPEELPFIDDEPPAHFVVRPKPRVRMYATLVHKVEITVVVPMPPQKITLNFSVGE